MKALQRVAFALYIASLVAAFGSPAKADESNKLTIFTFSQPVELPGNKVLPAGTYAFKLMDSASDRNIVQVFDKDMTKLYATILTVPDYRPQPHDKTIIFPKTKELPVRRKSAERTGGQLVFRHAASNAPQDGADWTFLRRLRPKKELTVR